MAHAGLHARVGLLCAMAAVATLLSAGCRKNAVPPASAEPPDPSRVELKLEQLRPELKKPTGQLPTVEMPPGLDSLLAAGRKELRKSKETAFLEGVLESVDPSADHYPLVIRTIGLAYARASINDQADQLLSKSAELAGDDIEVHLALGTVRSAAKDTNGAILEYRRALLCTQAKPDNPLAAEALLRLADALDKDGYHAAALDCLTELQTRIDQHRRKFSQHPLLRPTVLRPERMMVSRGELLSKLARHADAAEMFETAFRYDRSKTKPASMLIDALIAAGLQKKGEAILVEMAAEPAQRKRLPRHISKLCQSAGDASMPGRIADALLPKQLLTGESALALSDAAARLGAADEACRILRSFLDSAPSDEDVASKLAAMYSAQGRYQPALMLLARMLSENPSAAVAADQAIAQIAGGQAPADIEHTFSLGIIPGRLPATVEPFAAHYIAGSLAEAFGSESLAASEYRKAMDADRTFSPAYEAVAELYIRTSQKARLQRVLQQAETAAPDGFLAPYLRAKALLADGMHAKASEQLAIARGRNATHLPTLLLLGETLLRTGRPARAEAVLQRAVQTEPDSVKAYRLLFDACMARKRYRRAAALVAILKQRRPDDPTGKRLSAKLALQTGKLDQAAEILEQLRRQEPQDNDVILLGVQLALARGQGPLPEHRLKWEVKRVREVIRRDPDNVHARSTMEQLFQRQGENGHDHAVNVWGDLYEQTGRREELAKPYCRALLNAGKGEKASEILEDMVSRNPDDMTNHVLLVKAYGDMGESERASQKCQAAQNILDERIAAAQTNWQSNQLRRQKLDLYWAGGMHEDYVAFGREWLAETSGNVALKRLLVTRLSEGGRNDLAHRLLDEWIAQGDPNRDSHRRAKIELFITDGLDDKAREYAIGWSESRPGEVMPRLAAVMAFVEANKQDQAQQLVDEWAEKSLTPPATQPAQPATQPTTTPVDAADAWARQWAVRILLSQHEFAAALDRANKYLSHDPNSQQLLIFKSICLSELEQNAEALEAMEAAYQLDSSGPAVNNNLGYLYAQNGIKLDVAERMIRRALSESPNEVSYKDSLGWVFYKQGKIEQAGRVFEKILADPSKIGADHPVIYDHAGDTLWRLGKSERAVKLWREAAKSAEKTERKTLEIRQVLKKAGKKILAAEAGKTPAVAPLGAGYSPPDNKNNP